MGFIIESMKFISEKGLVKLINGYWNIFNV